jgi:hypothetical protein
VARRQQQLAAERRERDTRAMQVFAFPERADPAVNIPPRVLEAAGDAGGRQLVIVMGAAAPSRSQSFGGWLDLRPEDDEPLSPEEHAALAASDADIAAGRTVSYTQVKQGLEAE